MDSKGNLYAAAVTSQPAEPSRSRRGSGSSAGPPTPTGPPPPGGGPPQENKSNLYKIRPDGTAVSVWNSPEPLILAIVLESDSQILVGTGNEGKIYRVNPMTGDYTEIGKCSADQVVAIHQREVDGKPTTLLATGNPGKLFTVTTDYVEDGTLESEVHNAQSLSRWGKLSWEGAMEEGTTITFSTRTGNTKSRMTHGVIGRMNSKPPKGHKSPMETRSTSSGARSSQRPTRQKHRLEESYPRLRTDEC